MHSGFYSNMTNSLTILYDFYFNTCSSQLASASTSWYITGLFTHTLLLFFQLLLPHFLLELLYPDALSFFLERIDVFSSIEAPISFWYTKIWRCIPLNDINSAGRVRPIVVPGLLLVNATLRIQLLVMLVWSTHVIWLETLNVALSPIPLEFGTERWRRIQWSNYVELSTVVVRFRILSTLFVRTLVALKRAQLKVCRVVAFWDAIVPRRSSAMMR